MRVGLNVTEASTITIGLDLEMERMTLFIGAIVVPDFYIVLTHKAKLMVV